MDFAISVLWTGAGYVDSMDRWHMAGGGFLFLDINDGRPGLWEHVDLES
jgi:hypothetical protein